MSRAGLTASRRSSSPRRGRSTRSTRRPARAGASTRRMTSRGRPCCGATGSRGSRAGTASTARCSDRRRERVPAPRGTISEIEPVRRPARDLAQQRGEPRRRAGLAAAAGRVAPPAGPQGLQRRGRPVLRRPLLRRRHLYFAQICSGDPSGCPGHGIAYRYASGKLETASVPLDLGGFAQARGDLVLGHAELRLLRRREGRRRTVRRRQGPADVQVIVSFSILASSRGLSRPSVGRPSSFSTTSIPDVT